MVRHWFTVREPGWRWRATVNAVGGILTLVVLAVVASVKFVDGAWLVVILIPIQIGIFLFIHRQYAATRASWRCGRTRSSRRAPSARSGSWSP